MRRALLVFVVFLACIAAPAHAAINVHLAWGDSPNHGGALNQSFDCVTPGQTSTLVVSLSSDETLAGVTNVHVVLRGVQSGPAVCDCFCPWGCPYPPIPAYWDLGAGCRAGAVTPAANFMQSPYADSPTVQDPWHGAALVVGGAWVLHTDMQPNGDTHYTTYGVDVAPQAGSVDLAGGAESYLAAIAFADGTTRTLHTCDGCCLPMLFTVNVTVSTASGDLVLTGGSDGFTSWQGTGATCLQVPTRTSTWGSLKAVYR